jgi:penicillin-binding protein 1A
LLYHVTDHLNQGEFGQLARLVGLGRGKEESYEDYKIRIRDKHGIVVNDDVLMSVSFEETLKEIVPDLIFSSREDVLDDLSRLQFRMEDRTREGGKDNTYTLSFERLQELNLEMNRKLDMIKTAKENSILKDEKDGVVGGFYLSKERGLTPRLEYFSQVKTSGVHKTGEAVTLQWFMNNPNLIDMNHIWIEGIFPSAILDMIQSGMGNYYIKLKKLPSYDPEILFKVRDFRALVGLLYVIQLAGKMGISGKLDPVLSFPLGSNAISIAEAATVYQTIMTGKVYSNTDEISPGSVRIINKILDRNGTVIWEADRKSEKILSDRVRLIVRDILRQVIENGTGKSARDKIKVKADMNNAVIDIPIPVFGKTGTSNDYTNSSFVGFIPKPGDIGGDDPRDGGYSIACYVGYDDNQPMKGEKITIYGSSGALPIWIDTANAIVNSKDFLSNLQIADLVFASEPEISSINAGLSYVVISPVDGLPIQGDEMISNDEIRVLSDIGKENNTIVLKKRFEPVNQLLAEGVPAAAASRDAEVADLR